MYLVLIGVRIKRRVVSIRTRSRQSASILLIRVRGAVVVRSGIGTGKVSVRIEGGIFLIIVWEVVYSRNVCCWGRGR